MNLGKSWDAMSAEERAIFTAHLMYEPHRERLLPAPHSLTAEEFAAEWESLTQREHWIADAEDWLERKAITSAAAVLEKNRTVWSRKP